MQTFLSDCTLKRNLNEKKVVAESCINNIIKLSEGSAGKFYKVIKLQENNKKSMFFDKINYYNIIKVINISYKRNYFLVDNGEAILNLPKMFAKDIWVVSF